MVLRDRSDVRLGKVNLVVHRVVLSQQVRKDRIRNLQRVNLLHLTGEFFPEGMRCIRHKHLLWSLQSKDTDARISILDPGQ